MVKGVVDRFSEEFVETRRKALDKFLKRITDHPVLSLVCLPCGVRPVAFLVETCRMVEHA